jgi:hypothetical protein
MTATTVRPYREWSRYEWASVRPEPDERDVPRWNLAAWVGDQGRGATTRPIPPADAPPSEAGFSGFGHNPGGGSRWAEGYRH